MAVATSPDEQILGSGASLAGADWVPLPPYADAGGFENEETPHHSGIEMAVTAWDSLDWQGPESSIPSTLTPGKIIGFQVVVRDHDSDLPQQGRFYTLFGLPDFWRYADNFIDGVLMGQMTDPISPSIRPQTRPTSVGIGGLRICRDRMG